MSVHKFSVLFFSEKYIKIRTILILNELHKGRRYFNFTGIELITNPRKRKDGVYSNYGMLKVTFVWCSHFNFQI